MPGATDREQQMLEDNLQKALEEAWAKANIALQATKQRRAGFEKEIWLAAEAAEYCSLLFSLTHGLEDIDPPLRDRKGEDTQMLVKESVEELSRLRASRQETPDTAYARLRNAVHSLRNAYMDGLRDRQNRGSL